MTFLWLPAHNARAQTANPEKLAQRIQQLTDAMARTQAQLEMSQRELVEMRQQLSELKRQIGQSGATDASSSTASAAQTPSTLSQSASESMAKVESNSKYPVKVTGMLLMNVFINTSAVDIAATPSVAIPGSGSAGASVRQTILGFDAYGPHLFGGRSFADLRIDFYGNQTTNTSATSYSGYYYTNFPLGGCAPLTRGSIGTGPRFLLPSIAPS